MPLLNAPHIRARKQGGRKGEGRIGDLGELNALYVHSFAVHQWKTSTVPCLPALQGSANGLAACLVAAERREERARNDE